MAQEVFTSYEDAFEKIQPNASSYLVIVTRGHKEDMRVLAWAVRTDARYVGMIGSKRKVLSVYKALEREGYRPEEFERVHAPMGLEIGALSPEEIAISIAAELVAVRRNAEAAAHKKVKSNRARRPRALKTAAPIRHYVSGRHPLGRRVPTDGLAQGPASLPGTPLPRALAGRHRSPKNRRPPRGARRARRTDRRRRASCRADEIVINEDWEKGQLSSLQAAIRSLPPGTDGLILCLIDHPLISAALVDDLIEQFYATKMNIVLPVFRGQRGHPVIFSSALYDELLAAPLDKGARAVVWAHSGELAEMATTEQGCVLNLNDPETLQKSTGGG